MTTTTEIDKPNPQTKKPILCLDFDGVLHSYTTGWQGADKVTDPPVPGSAAFIVDASEFFEVHVYSSRSHQKGGIEAMREWCFRHFGDDITSLLCFPSYKPSAMVTLDDRAKTFIGVWPEVRTLRDFKPWNKKS